MDFLKKSATRAFTVVRNRLTRCSRQTSEDGHLLVYACCQSTLRGWDIRGTCDTRCIAMHVTPVTAAPTAAWSTVKAGTPRRSSPSDPSPRAAAWQHLHISKNRSPSGPTPNSALTFPPTTRPTNKLFCQGVSTRDRREWCPHDRCTDVAARGHLKRVAGSAEFSILSVSGRLSRGQSIVRWIDGSQPTRLALRSVHLADLQRVCIPQESTT